MRSTQWFWYGLGVLAGLSGLVAGCDMFARFDACSLDPDCIQAGGLTGSSSSGDAGPPKECIPSLSSKAVEDSCGVFASSTLGDDGNAGTSKSAPVKSLKRALMVGAQSNLPVYACAEEFANADGESLNVSAGSVMFGGLDCAGDWSYVGEAKKSVVQGAADEVALVLRSGSGVTRVEDFVVRAADAVMAGGSSIAVLAEPSNVELTRCELIAGKGQDGAKGITPTDDIGPSDANDLKIKGGAGAKAGMGDVVNGNAGGLGTVNALCMSAVGGNGGAGFVDHGGDGTDGLPALGAGKAGVGQPMMDMGNWDCIVGIGQLGKNGAPGTEGASATEADLGTLDLNGFVSAPGQSGSDGLPGQGGGGAGAAKGKAGLTGASGGGGGAGGCGGKGGGGGQGGGASVGLASLGATLTFNEVLVTAGTGGRGGDGGLGQGGATGGAGGTGGAGDLNAPATLDACNGGQGGKGGKGGDGGAGRGGHAVGLMYLGAAPPLEGVTFSIGTAGAGGQAFMSTGAAGIAADTLELP